MLREKGTPCPVYTFSEAKVGEDKCSGCDGCRGVFANGVDCWYSPTPTSEPKFKVGQTIYWLGSPGFEGVVKRIEWDGRFQWRYYAPRERYGHEEKNCFATFQERWLAEMQLRAKWLFRDAKTYADRYGLPLKEVNRLLLPEKKD